MLKFKLILMIYVFFALNNVVLASDLDSRNNVVLASDLDSSLLRKQFAAMSWANKVWTLVAAATLNHKYLPEGAFEGCEIARVVPVANKTMVGDRRNQRQGFANILRAIPSSRISGFKAVPTGMVRYPRILQIIEEHKQFGV